MKFGSRQKGSKAEIEVAKAFEAWWAPVDPGSKFVRTPLSGGWGGKDIRAGFRAAGDLMSTAPSFPFTVEVKRREGWSWTTLIAGKRCPVWNWWKQSIGQAREQGGIPLLVFRRNREEWSVMLPLLASLDSGLFKSPTFKDAWSAFWTLEELQKGKVECEILPAAIRLDWFLEKDPRDWLRVAATFPAP